MILSAAESVLRSRFTPMPANMHLCFCVFATVVFLIIFLRRRTVSSIIWLLICDATAILQLFHDSRTATAVGICEVFLFAVLIWVSIGERREQKLIEASKAVTEADEETIADDSESPAEASADDLSDIERLIKAERSKLIDDGSNDIIGNAFEDDKL